MNYVMGYMYRLSPLFFLGVFAQFDQCAHGALGVQEGDIEAFGAFARSFVDDASAFFLNFVERCLYAALDCKSDVLDAATAAIVGDELADGAVFGCAFEEFELGLTYAEEGCAYFLVGYFFNGKAFEA